MKTILMTLLTFSSISAMAHVCDTSAKAIAKGLGIAAFGKADAVSMILTRDADTVEYEAKITKGNSTLTYEIILSNDSVEKCLPISVRSL